MKATGIVRRIDDLGRVVVPKEIRRTLRIREGDPLEIFVDRDGEVILKKYSPLRELAKFSMEYADSLFEVTGHISCISDCDMMIAISGVPGTEYLNKMIGPDIEQVLQGRKSIHTRIAEDHALSNDYLGNNEVIAPIILQGDPLGSVMLIAKDFDTQMGDLEIKLAETAASFLAKRIEQ
jgi:AbrB family transcriptional regulator (stage V sporulation protein T)